MKDARLPHYFQYFALRGAVSALDRLSLPRAGRIGAWIGSLGYRPLGIRRAVVERQVRAAFPEYSAADVIRVSRAAYAHLGRTTIEAALLPACSREQILAMFERTEGADVVARARGQGRGVLLVSGHLGNWELAGAFVAASGIPIEAVARGMENPLFDRYVTATRNGIGMTVIHDSDAVRRVPRATREGHAVAMLVDQGAAGLASTWVPFFGRLAKTPRGPAVFALRLKVLAELLVIPPLMNTGKESGVISIAAAPARNSAKASTCPNIWTSIHANEMNDNFGIVQSFAAVFLAVAATLSASAPSSFQNVTYLFLSLI